MDLPVLRDVSQLTPVWVALIFLLVMMVLAWVNITAPRKWVLLGAAVSRARIPRQAFREEIDIQDRSLIGLTLAAVLVLALFGLQVATINGPDTLNIGTYLIYVAVVLGVLIATILLIRFTTWMFNSELGLHEYLYHTILLLIVLGLALLPIGLLLAYSGHATRALALVGCALIALFMTFRWMRAAVIGIAEGIRPQDILLYLCAAEILPAALAVSTLELSLPQ